MGAQLSGARAAVRVGHLALRLPRAELAHTAQTLIEEALELCGAEWGGQHIVIRHLRLARFGLRSARERQQVQSAIRAAMHSAASRAVPATSAFAQQADVVVFGSALEARAMLACQLLCDRDVPMQWYWRRAVPEWKPGAGAQPLLMALTGTAEGRVALAKAMAAPAGHDAVSEYRRTPPALTEAAAEQLLTLWPGFTRLKTMPVRAVSLWVGVQRLIAQAPYLAAEPALVHRAIVADMQPVMQPVLQPVLPASHATSNRTNLSLSDALHGVRKTLPLPRAALPMLGEMAVLHAESAAPVAEASSVAAHKITCANAVKDERQAAPHDEMPSTFAGLFLLIQPLRFLGFEAWLAQRPALAAEGFGWQLLAHVAGWQKLPVQDGAKACLREMPGQTPDALLPDTAALHAWRAALNGLLRRRCGHSLACVVKRRGWITRSDTGLTVRFPQNGADIGIRRMRFDLDPKFVPWLGLNVAYRYEDRWGS